MPLSGAAVVEFGAGTGKNTAWLASQARSLTALDLSPAMLAIARRRVPDPHVRCVEHDTIQPWPVPDGRADVVVGTLVLEHIAALPPVCVQARRALRPGGTLAVSEFHPMRQRNGAGAILPDERRILTFLHEAADYLDAALGAGFLLRRRANVRDPDGAPGALPRLIQLVWEAQYI